MPKATAKVLSQSPSDRAYEPTLPINGHLPTYRLREGYTQAIVTLTDALSGKRKDYWLGEYGSRASYERYHRLLARWEACGRRFPPPEESESGEPRVVRCVLVQDISAAYWEHASSYYTPGAAGHVRTVNRLLCSLFGSKDASTFGPNDLRLVRDAMIRGDASAEPPRKPWSRVYVNSQIHRLCRMFKWAASHEMVPIEVYHRLKSVTALRRGRSNAPECESITPVPVEQVQAVRPFLNRQIRALVDLQLFTGARGGELFKLRPMDIQTDKQKGVWIVELGDHKTAYLGHRRTIYMGPKAQRVLQPFMCDRSPDAYLFSPAEAERERRLAVSKKRTTPQYQGNSVGTNRVASARKRPGAYYTAASYRKAIATACDRAFPFTSEESSSMFNERQWKRQHRWHPHQLRHTAATLIRRDFGLEAARIALGHSSALITDAIYAERDMDRVVQVMRKMG